MAYRVTGVSIQVKNDEEGIKDISMLWEDILSGKIPLLYDSEKNFIKGISPVSEYSDYESDENGLYNLTIMGVKSDFFTNLEEKVSKGDYKKYDISEDSGNLELCTKKAWIQVWQDSKDKVINRAFTKDYESTVPAEFTKDGKAHCYLYIAVK